LIYAENESSSKLDQETSLKKLEEIFVDLLFDGYSIELINDIISLLNLNDENYKENEDQVSSKTSIKKLVKLALNKLSHILVKEKNNASKTEACLSKLNILLETTANHLANTSQTTSSNSNKKQQSQNNKKVILNDEDVMQCMRSFCNDQQIDINIRLIILEDLKKIVKSMSETDLMLLLVYKTNAILTNVNNFKAVIQQPIDSDQIENEEKRREFFNDLIVLSESEDDFKALLNLVKIWPKFTSSSNNQDVLILIFARLLSKLDTFTDLIESFKLNNSSYDPFTVSELSHIRQDIESHEEGEDNIKLKFRFIKLALLLKSKDTDNYVKNLMKNDKDLNSAIRKTFDKNQPLVEDNSLVDGFLFDDKELMDILHKDNFYIEIIDTNFYNLFVNYMIKNEIDTAKLFSIVKCLEVKGFELEAACFISEIENLFDSYKSLSVSLALLEKFN
jgi:hypothetical protein